MRPKLESYQESIEDLNLTEDEERLLDAFDAMTDEQREKFLAFAEMLYQKSLH